MDTSEPRVVVIGAGIAGLTLAAGLTRAGVPCTVFEQAPYLAEVGAGIQLAPNAARSLHRLGLADCLAKVAVQPAAIQMSRWDDGRTLMRTPLAECERLFGAPYYTAHRADLHSGLLELLPPGVVRTGMRCTGVEETGDGVTLRFESGQVLDADLAVGADGIHSVVRDARTRDQPRFSGQTIYRGLVPAEDVSFLSADPRVQLWLGPGQHAVAYPVSGGRMVSFGATTPATGWWTESWSAAGDVGELLAAYPGWHPEVRTVLAAAGSVGRWALHDRDTLDWWSGSRTTLIGDAAHPMLPFLAQGANQAIEDAVTLATLLCRAAPTDVGTALERYEALRIPRTETIHRISRENNRMLHIADGVKQARRDEELVASADLTDKEWLFGHDAELTAQQ